MKKTLLIALALVGCTGVHVPPPAADACTPVLEDAAVQLDAGTDAGPALARGDTFNARLACGIVHRFWRQQTADGAFIGCDVGECPFWFDAADPRTGLCDPAAVEWCLVELEGRANDCERYADVLAECVVLADPSCQEAP